MSDRPEWCKCRTFKNGSAIICSGHLSEARWRYLNRQEQEEANTARAAE